MEKEPESNNCPPPEKKSEGFHYSSDSDDEFYNDGYHRMTDDEWNRYNKEIQESDGFYVGRYPKVFQYGLIVTGCLNNKSLLADYEYFAKFAIKKKDASLKFVKIINATTQAGGPMNYYLTFEAKDRAGRIKIYQALVHEFIPVERSAVGLFRLKPGQ